MNDPRGSVWRKWDLHLHTPASGKDYEDQSVTDELLIANIKAAGIEAVAITDHHKIDVTKIINLQNKAGNELQIFPGIEFRSELGGRESVHFTGIFPNNLLKIDLEDIWTKISGACKLTDKDRQSIGEDKLYCDLKDTASLIHELGGLVIVHAGTKTNTIENIKSNLEKFKDQIKTDLVQQYIDILEIGKAGDQSDYITKVFPSLGFRLPMICCSDNHNIKNYKDCRFSWIKADPTFEGLKQIIYEPEERVRIQDSNPEYDYPKPFFGFFKIKNTRIFDNSAVEFSNVEVPLNLNLVTIIGGRGTGKSLLLDAFAKTFAKEGSSERAKEINISQDNFVVRYNKDKDTITEYKISSENALDYLHINQGDVKFIADPKDPQRLDEEIKSLLNLPSEPPKKYDESSNNRLIDEIFEINDFLNEKDEKDNLINSIAYLEKIIKQRKDLIENITTKDNKEHIDNYTQNVSSVSNCDELIRGLGQLKQELLKFGEEKNGIITVINTGLNDHSLRIPEINFNAQILKIEKLIEFETKKIKDLEQQNTDIKDKFKSKGITGDIASLLEQVKNYQQEINDLEKKKEKVIEKQRDISQKFTTIYEVIAEQSQAKEHYKQNINNKWQTLKKGKEDWDADQKKLVGELLEDIEIEVVEEFRNEELYKLIINQLNLKKFQETKTQTHVDRITEFFNINKKEDFINFIKNKKITKSDNGVKKCLSEIINSEYFVIGGAKEFLKALLNKNNLFWRVIVRPKYKNKELSHLSVGMKGTMYICLKLSTDPFLKPFIYDQPEDDLDNDFIMNELVPIFKKIKKYRQVIIVTHNANMVVNADAEQVIIAENNNEKISYSSGSIENISIRKKICDILEGGETAFKQRERKYAIKH